MKACLLSGSVRAVGDRQAAHLGPHVGPCPAVVRRQRAGEAVAGELGVALEEPPGKLGLPEVLEVHS